MNQKAMALEIMHQIDTELHTTRQKLIRPSGKPKRVQLKVVDRRTL